MAYSNFTLKTVAKTFSLSVVTSVNLFKETKKLKISNILKQILDEVSKIPVLSEKAKSEAIVFPILQELNRHNNFNLGLFSGVNLDADGINGLNGECDFILTTKNQKFLLENPIFGLVEAKKDDVDEAALGQCAAQMYGARVYNKKDGQGVEIIYGCVTTGQIWQFLKLEKNTLYIDEHQYFIDSPEKILGILQAIVDEYR